MCFVQAQTKKTPLYDYRTEVLFKGEEHKTKHRKSE